MHCDRCAEFLNCKIKIEALIIGLHFVGVTALKNLSRINLTRGAYNLCKQCKVFKVLVFDSKG